jgi:RNA polymerase sigma factor (sigma-70 family)
MLFLWQRVTPAGKFISIKVHFYNMETATDTENRDIRDELNVHTIRKSDAEVWQELKQGEKKALERIFRRYYGDLYKYGVKLTGQPALVEDELQSLFLKIWNNRKNLGDVSGVKTYLWTALRRRLIAEKQKKHVGKGYFNSDPSAKQEMQFSAEELIIHREHRHLQARALKQALNRLSGKRREIMYLKYYDGLSYEEIQQVMGISYQTARNYIYEGLEALRTFLDESSTGVTLAVAGITGLVYAAHLLFGLL